MFAETIEKIKLTEDIIEHTRKALLNSSKDEQEFRSSQITSLSTRYQNLDSYINRSYQDKLDGKIEPNFWEQKTAEWKNEQAEIQNQLEALRNTNTAYMLEGVKLMEIANRASELFKEASKEEKRQLLNLILSNPQVVNGNIEYHYRKPFDMFVNVTDLAEWRGGRDRR